MEENRLLNKIIEYGIERWIKNESIDIIYKITDPIKMEYHSY